MVHYKPMQEIELKVLDINKESFITKLESIGARRVGVFFIHDRTFDFDDERVRQKGDLFRLRVINGDVELVYKDDTKTGDGFREQTETQTGVTDLAAMETILKKIGCRPVRDRQKIRTEYLLGKTKFEIDEFPDIPPYLEMEGSKESIVEALKRLGYKKQNTTDMTATKVLESYGVDPSTQEFAAGDPRLRLVNKEFV